VSDAHAQYWREALEYAFDGCDLWSVIKDVPSAKLDELGASLATSAECQDQAFHRPENPMIRETDILTRKLTWERERIGCEPCGGSGRLKYNAGPWGVNTGCHVCGGAGKVHPRKEREPA